MQKGIGTIHTLVIFTTLVLVGVLGYVTLIKKPVTPAVTQQQQVTPPATNNTPAQNPPAQPQSSKSSFTVVTPNGGETFTLDSEVNVEIFVGDDIIAKFSNSDVVQLYLISDSETITGGILGVYVKDPEATFALLRSKNFPDYYRDVYEKLSPGVNKFVWKPEETFANAGLEDRALTDVKPGKYKLMLLARKPIRKEGGPIGDYGKHFGSRLFEGTSDVSGQSYYIAADFSDSYFTIR